MKEILISIHPKCVGLILNEIKTLELRKSFPKCELPIKVYIYCIKGGRPLVYGDVLVGDGVFEQRYTQTYNWSKKDAERIWGNLQGKVVAEFTLKQIDTYTAEFSKGHFYEDIRLITENH